MKAHVEYLRDVTSPQQMAGNKGDKKHIFKWHADQLLEEGFVRLVEHPETGEPIIYPPDPPPLPKSDREWVVVSAPPSDEAITITEGARDGSPEQATSEAIGEAPIGKSSDTRVG